MFRSTHPGWPQDTRLGWTAPWAAAATFGRSWTMPHWSGQTRGEIRRHCDKMLTSRHDTCTVYMCSHQFKNMLCKAPSQTFRHRSQAKRTKIHLRPGVFSERKKKSHVRLQAVFRIHTSLRVEARRGRFVCLRGTEGCQNVWGGRRGFQLKLFCSFRWACKLLRWPLICRTTFTGLRSNKGLVKGTPTGVAEAGLRKLWPTGGGTKQILSNYKSYFRTRLISKITLFPGS